jgi:hypothetical protein
MGRPVYVADEAGASAALDRLGALARDRLVVEDPDRPIREEATVTGTARIVRDEPERVEVVTACESPSYLFLADTHDPGWSTTVDGRTAPIRPAYSAFRAVALPKGEHTVVFTYVPAGFRLGLAVTLASLAMSAVLLAWPRRVFTLDPEHGELRWPRFWPAWGLAVLAAIVIVSAVGIDAAGRPKVHSRWTNGLHRFTWGAGYEAMELQRRK